MRALASVKPAAEPHPARYLRWHLVIEMELPSFPEDSAVRFASN
jgi:hypothetical protein